MREDKDKDTIEGLWNSVLSALFEYTTSQLRCVEVWILIFQSADDSDSKRVEFF